MAQYRNPSPFIHFHQYQMQSPLNFWQSSSTQRPSSYPQSPSQKIQALPKDYLSHVQLGS